MTDMKLTFIYYYYYYFFPQDNFILESIIYEQYECIPMDRREKKCTYNFIYFLNENK